MCHLPKAFSWYPVWDKFVQAYNGRFLTKAGLKKRPAFIGNLKKQS